MQVDTNINNIQKTLKKIIFYLGLGMIGGIMLLVYLYSSKKSTSNNVKQSISFENKQCKIDNIIYKEHYISLESKNCNQIKIINIDNFNILDIKN